MEKRNETMSDISYSSMHDMLKDYLHDIQLNAAKLEVPGISSGFCSLDDLTCGFEPGKVYVIGARPAMGKITFMLSMIRDITLESKVPVLMFSTNHLKQDYINRLLSIHCDIPSSQLHKGWLKSQEWYRLDKEISTLFDAPLFIHDSMDLPLDELVETAHRCIKDKGIKIIFIDCLQMIDFAKTDGNASERVEKVMSAMKQLAYETKLPIVVGAILNRDVDYREGIEDKRPQLKDLANSCYIEELADVVMMVHRPEYYMIFKDKHGRNLRGLMEIIVMKNDFKPLGSVMLDYQQSTGHISIRKDVASSAQKPVNLKDFETKNEAVKKLIETFDLEERLPL